MAWMPGAIRKEVTRHRTAMTARRFVFHTAVSAASSLFDYFNQPGNATSHFYIRADGIIEQYVDTQYRAPAQLDGNHDCVSVETQDMGPAFPVWSGSDVPAWSPAQMTALTQMSAWVAMVHGIPLVQIPDSVNGRTGFGYHRLGINPWRVPTGELWSNSTGKACPGDRRIAQIPGILAQAAQGDDMSFEDADRADLKRIKALLEGTTGDRIGDLWGREGEILGYVSDVQGLADALAPLIVAQLPDPTALSEQQIEDALTRVLERSVTTVPPA